jgi:hypothetical protein
MIRRALLFTALLLLASFAWGQDLKPYQTGKVLQMGSVPCHASQKAQEPACSVYLLEAEGVVFHIRAKSAKHAPLLPVGQRAQFRIAKGNILLHMDGIDSREREYIVVSMSPRTGSDSADATPVRLNHLQ